MKTTIQTLKEELSKAKSKCELHLKYEEKIIRTKIKTTNRINTQVRKNIEMEKKNVVGLKKREDEVFDKIKSYLNQETTNLENKIKEWNVSRTPSNPPLTLIRKSSTQREASWRRRRRRSASRSSRTRFAWRG